MEFEEGEEEGEAEGWSGLDLRSESPGSPAWTRRYQRRVRACPKGPGTMDKLDIAPDGPTDRKGNGDAHRRHRGLQLEINSDDAMTKISQRRTVTCGRKRASKGSMGLETRKVMQAAFICEALG